MHTARDVAYAGPPSQPTRHRASDVAPKPTLLPTGGREAPAHWAGSVGFMPPEGWDDVTVFTACGKPREGSRFTPILRMAREPMSGATLQLHAFQVTIQIAKQAPQCEVLSSDEIEVAGRPAVRVRMRTPTDVGPVAQILVIVDPGAEDRRVATFNASGPEERMDEMEAAIADILRSVRVSSVEARPLPQASLSTRSLSAPPLPFVPMPGVRTKTRQDAASPRASESA